MDMNTYSIGAVHRILSSSIVMQGGGGVRNGYDMWFSPRLQKKISVEGLGFEAITHYIISAWKNKMKFVNVLSSSFSLQTLNYTYFDFPRSIQPF